MAPKPSAIQEINTKRRLARRRTRLVKAILGGAIKTNQHGKITIAKVTHHRGSHYKFRCNDCNGSAFAKFDHNSAKILDTHGDLFTNTCTQLKSVAVLKSFRSVPL